MTDERRYGPSAERADAVAEVLRRAGRQRLSDRELARRASIGLPDPPISSAFAAKVRREIEAGTFERVGVADPEDRGERIEARMLDAAATVIEAINAARIELDRPPLVDVEAW